MTNAAQQVVDLANVDIVPATQEMDTDAVQAAGRDPSGANVGATNTHIGQKRQASSTDAGAGPSGVEHNNSNNSNQFFPSLTAPIYTEIENSAKAAVQPAVSAVIKVDQQVVKAEKHLHKLLQQLESGTPTFSFLRVSKPELQYDSAEAQAMADAAVVEYQRQLLAAAIKGAEARLAALKQEQLSIKITAILQMKQDSFGDLSEVWSVDAMVQAIQQQQVQLFEWELAKARRNAANTEKQLAQKQAKKAAAAAAAEAEAGPTSLQEQVEELVAKTVPKVLAAQSATTNNNNGGNSSGNNSTGGSSKGKGQSNKQQQPDGKKQQQQQPDGKKQQQQQNKPPPPAPAAPSSFLDAAKAGRNRSLSRGRSRSRSRFYNTSKGGGGASSSGSNQGHKGAQKQQHRQGATA